MDAADRPDGAAERPDGGDPAAIGDPAATGDLVATGDPTATGSSAAGLRVAPLGQRQEELLQPRPHLHGVLAALRAGLDVRHALL